MQQIYEVKVITLTRGGLAGGKKFFSVVTTNCKKSAEVIVPKKKKKNLFGKDRTIISSE